MDSHLKRRARERYHSAMITPHVSLLDPATRDRLADLQRYFMAHGYPDPADAMHRAIIGDVRVCAAVTFARIHLMPQLPEC